MHTKKLDRLRRTWRGFVAGAIVSAAATSSALGQCAEGWVNIGPDQGLNGVNSTVENTCLWDPDGAGPLGNALVACGSFTEAGNALSTYVAYWDGSQWRRVGTLNSTVYDVESYNGELYATGSFSGIQTTNYIAKWSGTQWVAVGAGLNNVGYCMQVHNGKLFIGGAFSIAGNVNADAITSWNGTSYAGLASGKGISGPNVFEMTVWNGQLVAGGRFTSAGNVQASNVASWNDTTQVWSAVGAGTNGDVYALSAFGPNLIVGGSFAQAGGNAIPNIAQWNGSTWSSVGLVSGANSAVYALSTYTGSLIAGGSFNVIGGTSGTQGIAQWNGSSWQAVAGSVNSQVYSLSTFGGQLIAGGSFSAVNNSTKQAANIASYNGATWNTLGGGFGNGSISGRTIYASTVHGGEYVVGGDFVTAGNNLAATRIAKWNSSTWTTLGSGFNSTVQSLASYGGNLYAGGSFTTAGGPPAFYVAKWNGSNWGTLPGVASSQGTDNAVLAMLEFGGNLVIGGHFTNAGGVASRNRIAQWNGTSWSGMHTGFNSSVDSLAVYNTQLYAGGSFTQASGSPASYIARWNGSQWVPINSGFNGTVRALAVYNNRLVAGGSFSTSTPGSQYLAQYDSGSGNWSTLGASNQFNSTVHALKVYNGILYATGAFTAPGTYVAGWNGAAWTSLSSGFNNAAYTLENYSGRLQVGGTFTRAGSEVAWAWAQWTAGGSGRVFNQQPANFVACPDQSANFVVDVTGSGPYSYFWRKNGVFLTNGRGISGVNTPVLTINNLEVLDEANYDCQIIDSCGVFVSAQGVLTVDANTCTQTCNDIDFNNDGVSPDNADLEAFLRVLGGGPCTE